MFSVVIPLFEKRAYVQRALDSVYAQSIEAAAVPEIIVVNDGSTDGGREVAKSQADPRVRVIDQPNRGVSAARNAGIAAASQPFIAFLDADDRWRPEFLARMRELIAAHPGAALYGCGFTTVRGGSAMGDHGIRTDELVGGGVVAGAPAGRADFFRAWRRDHVIHTSGTVVPRDAARDVGGFAAGETHGEDHLFHARLALAGPVVLTSEPLVEYDVAVPGQAIGYWERGYRERFDILAWHRFLAEELRRRLESGSAADAAFVAFARRQLRTAALHRLYWGNFPAVDRLWRELRLDGLGLGAAAATAAWVARRKIVQPAARVALKGIRIVRRGMRAGAGAA